MADISTYLAAILSAVYGEDVRGSIHDAIEIINDVSEVVLSTGTAVTSASSSSEGFYTDSLYLNTSTYELWKCTGTDTWASLGVLKGDDGDPGTPGADGNKWYIGTGISGKAVNPTVYSGSGVTSANIDDCYLNNSEGAVYHCVSGGAASVATWVYDFTMTGGGGGTSDYADLTNKPAINGHTLSAGANSLADIGLESKTADSGGTAVSLCTTGEKYTWDNKSNFSGNYSDLAGKPTIPTVSVDHNGTASTSAVRKQRIEVSGTYYDVDGSVYMESTANSASFVFTNSTYILSTSAIDVFTDTWGDNPSSVVVDGSLHTCTVTFSAAASRTVRIYIK